MICFYLVIKATASGECWPMSYMNKLIKEKCENMNKKEKS